jgi:hypothetical protein
MADYNFDFNGDSLMPEQDNLFDDLLDDLAFQTEIANYDTTFLGNAEPTHEIKILSYTFLSFCRPDFDFGGGILDLPDSGGAVFGKCFRICETC